MTDPTPADEAEIQAEAADADLDVEDDVESPGAAFAAPRAARESPLASYVAVVKRYGQPALLAIHRFAGGADVGASHKLRPDWVADRLNEPKVADRLLQAVDPPAKLAMGLFALTETQTWNDQGLHLTLKALGVADPLVAIDPLLARGLVVARPGDPPPLATPDVLVAHPAAMNAARTIPPTLDPPAFVLDDDVRNIRQADGLELILRVATLWQRVAASPLRQTQHGAFFKRDRERLEDDPVLAGSIADGFEPLPDPVALTIDLARAVGMLLDEPGTDRVVAASADSWAENAVHLPQMLATRWMALSRWNDRHGAATDEPGLTLAAPYVRPAALLWLSKLPEDGWVALDDLAAHLDALAPGWRQPTVSKSRQPIAPDDSTSVLASILVGAAYQLGLTRTAESKADGRRVVQLTPLGRYALALGPPPPPVPSYEHFLFIQPNFEVIAYRQGLTPRLTGELGRFARWSRIGAALELKLTPESIYQGLEGGLTADAMIGVLERHSARGVPAAVLDAVRTWASRRELVTYYGSATLVEFTSPEDLRRALEDWPLTAGAVGPVRISERLLLVEDSNTIPFSRLRLAGSRDYRRPPEPCVEVEADGVTLALDLRRSDLLVDAEITRFADELPPASTRRRFVVSPASLARAANAGLTAATLTRWFTQRAGAGVPPAIRLLLHAASVRVDPIELSRPLVLSVETEDLLDGLLQHPDTCRHFGDRLGPTSAVVLEASWPDLRRALDALGLPHGDVAS